MSKLTHQATATVLATLSCSAFAETQEELLADITRGIFYAAIAFVVLLVIAVYFKKSRDKREAPMDSIFSHGEAIHSVRPDTPVSECARMMSAVQVGALVVLDGARLTGIFTERDALNKVLAAGLDARTTPVSDVMTRDPYCIAPTTTVGQAMEVVTKRRFRHLPVVENGKLLAVVSSGDLTRWMVEDQVTEVRELIALLARP